MASPAQQPYEHHQGVARLASMPSVLEFVNMKRFDDQDLLHVLEAMRTKGGKKLEDRVWARLKATVCKKDDPRLLAARG